MSRGHRRVAEVRPIRRTSEFSEGHETFPGNLRDTVSKSGIGSNGVAVPTALLVVTILGPGGVVERSRQLPLRNSCSCLCHNTKNK